MNSASGVTGLCFSIAGVIVLIVNIFIYNDQMTFLFVFMILSSGLILLGIDDVLDKLSDIEKKRKR